MYGAQKELAPFNFSCMRSSAIAMYSPIESGTTSVPSTACERSFVITSFMPICMTGSPCRICLRASRPRPDGSKSSMVSLSTRSGCAGRPHVLIPEMYTPLLSSQSSKMRSLSAVESSVDSGAHRSWHTGAIALLRATGVGAVGLTAGVSQSDGASVKRKMLDSIACAVWVPSFVGGL